MTYPVGSGEACPLAEHIKIIAPNTSLRIGMFPYKFGNKTDNSVLDIRRLKEDTGFKPNISSGRLIPVMLVYQFNSLGLTATYFDSI